MKSRSGMSARETIGFGHAFSSATYLSRQPDYLRTLCTRGEKKCPNRSENWVASLQFYAIFFKSPGDRQMTEMFVSGTEVCSDAKMTETPYE